MESFRNFELALDSEFDNRIVELLWRKLLHKNVIFAG